MRLTEGERRRWVTVAGMRLDAFRDRPVEVLTLDEHGRLRLDSTVSCGVYVVVDPDDVVLYVGKVHRANGSIADRFRDHHARNDDWDRVWILPVREDVDPSPIESAMIKHFQPQDNVAARA